MAAYVIADIRVTDPAGYEPYKPLASDASAVAFLPAAAGRSRLKARRRRSGSLSSNSPTPPRRSVGTTPRSIRPR